MASKHTSTQEGGRLSKQDEDYAANQHSIWHSMPQVKTCHKRRGRQHGKSGIGCGHPSKQRFKATGRPAKHEQNDCVVTTGRQGVYHTAVSAAKCSRLKRPTGPNHQYLPPTRVLREQAPSAPTGASSCATRDHGSHRGPAERRSQHTPTCPSCQGSG